MILTADFFDRVLKTLKTNAKSSDKRAAPRIGIRAQVRIARFNGKVLDTPQFVWTRDISRVGIGILSPKTMKVGQFFVLEMPQEDDEPVRVVCQVKCRQKIDEELCFIGAVFQTPLNNSVPAGALHDAPEPAVNSPEQDELIQRIRSTILG